MDAGQEPEDAGVIVTPPVDAGHGSADAGTDAGEIQITGDGHGMGGGGGSSGGTGGAGGGSSAQSMNGSNHTMIHGGCSSVDGLSMLALGLVAMMLARRRVAARIR
jgi:hypothetical protein